MYWLTSLLVVLPSLSPCLSVQYVPIFQGPGSWWSTEFPNLTDTSICPNLNAPSNGSVSVLGHIAVYSCLENFTLIGLDGNQRACVEADWIGEDPECKRDGGWSNWSSWTDCTKTCESGSRSRDRLCTNPPVEPGGKDCPGNRTDVEICNPSKCPECKAIQKDITVGLITLSLGNTGDFIQFSCPQDPPYRLVGNTTQPCDKDTELGPVTATCVRACPLLSSPSNGSVTLDEHNPDIAYYSCIIGFRLLGPQQRQCEDGVWSGTDPECSQELIEEDVEPVGTNPSIGLGVGVFDITSPNVPVSKCSGSVTFNLRTNTKQKLLKLSVSILLVLEDDQLSEPIAETVDDLNSSYYSAEEPQPACVTVICSDTQALLSPRAGRVRITVTVQDGTAEISNVNYADRFPCDAEIDEENVGNCNDSAESGDCGYRNSGCGLSNWDLAVNSSHAGDDHEGDEDEDGDSDEDGGNSLVPLLTNKTQDACQSFVCIKCLQDSGFSVSSRDSPTQATAPAQGRRKRGLGSFTYRANAFCLKAGTGFGEQSTPLITKAEHANYYVSFRFNMHRNGIHYIVFYVRCAGVVDVVHLKADRTIYSIFNSKVSGSQGRRCLRLHKNIDTVTKKCQKFRVYVQGISIGSNLCFSNVKFHGKSDVRSCAHGVVAND